jgi:hypothetical protein
MGAPRAGLRNRDGPAGVTGQRPVDACTACSTSSTLTAEYLGHERGRRALPPSHSSRAGRVLPDSRAHRPFGGSSGGLRRSALRHAHGDRPGLSAVTSPGRRRGARDRGPPGRRETDGRRPGHDDGHRRAVALPPAARAGLDRRLPRGRRAPLLPDGHGRAPPPRPSAVGRSRRADVLRGLPVASMGRAAPQRPDRRERGRPHARQGRVGAPSQEPAGRRRLRRGDEDDGQLLRRRSPA